MCKIFDAIFGFIENFCFLLSSMTLFFLFYSVKCFSIVFDGQEITETNIIKLWGCKHEYFVLTLIVSVLAIAGVIISIIFMCRKQDLSNEANGDALIFERDSLIDKIDNFYFSKFSLFVLTGLSLPQKSLSFSIILLMLFCFTIGFVYLKNNMFFINPILCIFGYSFFSGKPRNDNYSKTDELILLVKGKKIPPTIYIKNLNQKVYFIKYK